MITIPKTRVSKKEIIIGRCNNCYGFLIENGKKGKDEVFYCPKCYNKARAEALAEVNGIVDKFDFEVVKEKYKPNMDLIKLIKEELKSKLKQLEGKSLVEKGK